MLLPSPWPTATWCGLRFWAEYAAQTRDSHPDDSIVVVNHWAYAGRDTIARPVASTSPPDGWDLEDDPHALYLLATEGDDLL